MKRKRTFAPKTVRPAQADKSQHFDLDPGFVRSMRPPSINLEGKVNAPETQKDTGVIFEEEIPADSMAPLSAEPEVSAEGEVVEAPTMETAKSKHEAKSPEEEGMEHEEEEKEADKDLKDEEADAEANAEPDPEDTPADTPQEEEGENEHAPEGESPVAAEKEAAGIANDSPNEANAVQKPATESNEKAPTPAAPASPLLEGGGGEPKALNLPAVAPPATVPDDGPGLFDLWLQEKALQKAPEPAVQRQQESGAESAFEGSGFAAQVTAQATAAAASIRQKVQQAKAQAASEAAASKAAITQKVAAAIALQSQRLEEQKAQLRTSREQAKTTVTSKFAEARTNLQTKAEAGKAQLQNLLDLFPAKVDGRVQGHIGGVAQAKQATRKEYNRELTEQAMKAQNMGTSMHFESNDAGIAQKNAVIHMAKAVGDKIQGAIPETLSVLDDAYEGVPEEMLDAGEEIKEKSGENIEPLLEIIDDHVTAVSAMLDEQEQTALQALDASTPQAEAAMDQQHTQAKALLEQQGSQAKEIIDHQQERFATHIEAAPEQTIAEIEKQGQDMARILGEGDMQDEATAQAMVAQSATHFKASAQTANQQIAAAHSSHKQSTGQVSTTLDSGIAAVGSNVERSLQGIYDNSQQQVEGVVEAATNAKDFVSESTQSLNDQLHGEVTKALDASISELDSTCQNILSKAKEKVGEKVSEAKAQNDGVLAALPQKLAKVADRAKWEHEHPVLAKIRSGLEFVGGLVVGVLKGLAMALIFIALAAAVLAFLGLFMAGWLAMLIVAVGGLVMLGIQIYKSAKTQSAKGKTGWSAALGVLSDISGFDKFSQSWNDPTLSPFERGLAAGEGGVEVIMNVADLVVPAKRGGRAIGRLFKNAFSKGGRNAIKKGMKNVFKSAGGMVDNLLSKNRKPDPRPEGQSRWGKFKETFKTNVKDQLSEYNPFKKKPKPSDNAPDLPKTEVEQPKTDLEQPKQEVETPKTQEPEAAPPTPEEQKLATTIDAYQKRYPNRKVDPDAIAAKLNDGKEFNPKTGRFRAPQGGEKINATLTKDPFAVGNVDSTAGRNGVQEANVSLKDADGNLSPEMDALTKAREDIRLQKEEIRKALEAEGNPDFKDDPRWKELNQQQIKATEQAALQGTREAAIKAHGGDATVHTAESKGSGDYDIIVDADGKVTMLEVKGGSSQRGSRQVSQEGEIQHAEQGSRPYVESLIQSREKKIESAEQALNALQVQQNQMKTELAQAKAEGRPTQDLEAQMQAMDAEYSSKEAALERDMELQDKISTALDNNELTYQQATLGNNKDGSLSNSVRFQQFDISKP